MDDTRSVGCRETFSRALQVTKQFCEIGLLKMDQFTQRLSIDELHRNEVRVAGFANFIDVSDVWVIERRGGFRFLHKPPHAVVLGGEFSSQYLQRHFAIELCILGQIDLAHSALANLRTDFITAEFCAGFDGHSLTLKSLISTTSLSTTPREKASHLPSRDQSKEKMRSVLKFVNCLGGPPSMG